MSISRFFLSLFLLFLCSVHPAFADQYDECINGCSQNLGPCSDQARLTAGNVQEEQDLIAACERNKLDCVQSCKDAETQPPPQPQPLPQEQPQEQTPNS
jgi:hypothetical protein